MTAWGGASGVGSLPGGDPAEALRLVLGELPDLPHLPELPSRGPGADMVGRTAAMLVDLAVDITPAGWRLVPRSGIDQRRAREFLARDLDALSDVADRYAAARTVPCPSTRSPCRTSGSYSTADWPGATPRCWSSRRISRPPSALADTSHATGVPCARSCTSARKGRGGIGPVQVGAPVCTEFTPARSAVPIVTVRDTGSMPSTYRGRASPTATPRPRRWPIVNP